MCDGRRRAERGMAGGSKCAPAGGGGPHTALSGPATIASTVFKLTSRRETSPVTLAAHAYTATLNRTLRITDPLCKLILNTYSQVIVFPLAYYSYRRQSREYSDQLRLCVIL